MKVAKYAHRCLAVSTEIVRWIGPVYSIFLTCFSAEVRNQMG